MILQIVDHVGLFLEQIVCFSVAGDNANLKCRFSHRLLIRSECIRASTSPRLRPRDTYRIEVFAEATHCVRRWRCHVESPHAQHIPSVRHQQEDRLARAEQHDVGGGREETLRAMLKEPGSVLILHQCLYGQDNGVPQRHNVQCNALMEQCGAIELMIAVHSQFLVVMLDDEVVQLSAITTDEWAKRRKQTEIIKSYCVADGKNNQRPLLIAQDWTLEIGSTYKCYHPINTSQI